MADDIKFVKYKRIPHLNEVPYILDKPVEVYEKIDGGNVQIRKINERILCGSRANFLTREKFFSQEWFKDFQKWALGNKSFYNLPENLIVYGEWSAKHTLNYKQEFTNKFFLIDVLDLKNNKFIPYQMARQFLSILRIDDLIYLESLSLGKTSEEALIKLLDESKYRHGEREGFVIKNYDSQEFAKLWTSSVKRKGIITISDIENILLGLKDSEREISEERVVKELESDFKRSNRQVTSSVIQSSVEDYFKKTFYN